MSTISNLNSYLETQRSRLNGFIKGRISSSYGEKKCVDEFSVRFIGEDVDVFSKGFLGEAFALNRLYSALASGYVADIPGTCTPICSTRPLWLVGSCKINITKSLACYVSPQLLEFDTREKQETLCRRLIEMGYNTLIIGGIKQDAVVGEADSSVSYNFNLLNETLALWNLNLIIKPDFSGDFCPALQEHRDIVQSEVTQLQKQLPLLSALFWESRLLHTSYSRHKSAKDLPVFDLVLEEVRLIEKSMKPNVKLIFYLPSHKLEDSTKQAGWFLSLSDEVAKNTTLAFSAMAGEPVKDHLPLNPVWEVLRCSPDIIHTPLMPVANFGSVTLGEGLWPSLPGRLLDQVFRHCERHRFVGVAGLSSTIPCEGGLLDCALWVAGHLMWENKASEFLMERWFKAFRPDLCYSKFKIIFLEMDLIRMSLSELKDKINGKQKNDTINDELRLFADSLLPRINQILHKLEVEERKNAKRSLKPSLYDYFIYFAADARRIILYAMQTGNLSCSGLSHEIDSKESFWTSYGQGGVMNSVSSGSISLLDEPQQGKIGSKMRQIYDERSVKTTHQVGGNHV